MDHLIAVAEKRVKLFAQGYVEGHEARAAMAEIIEQRDAFCLAAAKANKEADELRAAMAELVEAGRCLRTMQADSGPWADPGVRAAYANWARVPVGTPRAEIQSAMEKRFDAALARFEEKA